MLRPTLLAIMLFGHVCAADRITDAPFATRSEVIAPKAMAATSQPLATQIALDVMKQGGNAIDAAIAANAALGLMEPVGAGIGGDLFALVWDGKTRKLYGLNASGRSPRSLTLAQLKAELEKQGLKTIPPLGPLPVSVPGTVDGWFSLHARFGQLPMRDILAPSVRYGREGFPVSDVISYYWQRNVRSLLPYPGIREQFTRDGAGPQKGQLWTNPNLARTYEMLGKQGRDAFYKGEIARKIAAYMARNGGYLSYDDLASHKSEWVEPVSVNYRGMGSGMAPEDLGFILQDRGQLFALDPGHANVYAPGKRPFHTIIPAFISKDGQPWVSFGLMGGDMQPQGHTQIVMNLIDFGMNLQEAGDAPRIYWDTPQQPTGGSMTDGGAVSLETGFPYSTIQQLLQKRHKLGYDLGGYGGYQAIMRLPNGAWAGASESRKDGQAAGY